MQKKVLIAVLIFLLIAGALSLYVIRKGNGQKRYVSPDGMITFTYPDSPEWKLQNIRSRVLADTIQVMCEGVCPGQSVSVFQYSQATYRSLDEYITERAANMSSYSRTTLSGYEAVKAIQEESEQAPGCTFVFTVFEGTGYELAQCTKKGTSQAPANPDILSTFKYTNRATLK